MTYPDILKRAEVTPIYTKLDHLCKDNYRPISVLSATSKIVEGIICDQLLDYFSDLLSVMLAAYRKHYSCQNVLSQMC